MYVIQQLANNVEGIMWKEYSILIFDFGDHIECELNVHKKVSPPATNITDGFIRCHVGFCIAEYTGLGRDLLFSHYVLPVGTAHLIFLKGRTLSLVYVRQCNRRRVTRQASANNFCARRPIWISVP
ncbi:hypothetical protein ACS0PU_010397 [Formica fusca]